MSEDKTLKTIVHGAGIIFIGSILVYIFTFLYRIVLARYLGPSDYGLIMIAITVLSVGRIISLMGLTSGVNRFIGYYSGKKEYEKIKGIILSSIKLVFIFGLTIALLTYIFSKQISLYIFHTQELIPILKIFSIIIPLNALIELFKAIFLSFKRPMYSSFIEVFFEKLLNLIFVGAVIFFGSKLFGVSISYLIVYLIAVAFGFFILEFKTFSIIKSNIKSVYLYKEILSFSIPLLFVSLLIHILGWSDTFLLGYFKNEMVVGIYHVGFPLAYILLMFGRSFEALYFPMSSELLSQNKLLELSQTFNTIKRWIFILTYPTFLFFIFFAKTIIEIIFGLEYVAGWKVLIIISTGIFIASIFGPTDITLRVFKKTKFILKITVVLTLLNIILNLILIPLIGMEGAAISTSLLWINMGLFSFLKLKKLIKITYRKKTYLKYILSGIFSIILVFVIFKIILNYMNIYLLIISIILHILTYLSLLIMLKSFTKKDLMVLSMIKNKLKMKSFFNKN